MRRGILCLAGILGLSTFAYGSPLGYTLDVTTTYSAALPPGTLTPFGGPSPDTGYFTVTNNGTTTFTGSVGDGAVAGGIAPDFSFTASGLTLGPGQSIAIAVNDESSNMGGYNAPTGSVQPGVTIQINGSINGTEAINLSVNDADIHSGVPRTNPFGRITDAYVLQGGDPLGADTGDGFEETQAPGHFEFFEAGGGAVVPLPSTAVGGLSLLGLVGLQTLRRRVLSK